MQVFADALVLIGAVVLVVSLWPVRRLAARLSPGHVRRNWRFLGAMVFVFIAGYLSYLLIGERGVDEAHELIVPVIFFAGACFVLLVNLLSVQTADDIRRFAVIELENITDPLMKVHNRRYFDRRLAEETSRALRYSLPLSVLLMDVDDFKSINDSRGHLVGDAVLKGLGVTIVALARETDVVARYGGDEIVVIATSTPLQSAALFAERLRAAVAVPGAVDTGGVSDDPVTTTVSIGVASLGSDVQSAEALIARADEALYEAKRRGRDRVVCAEERDRAGEA